MNKIEEVLLEQKVKSLHGAGLPPSAIDERLRLDEGTAHDVMCEFWKREKMARTRNA